MVGNKMEEIYLGIAEHLDGVEFIARKLSMKEQLRKEFVEL